MLVRPYTDVVHHLIQPLCWFHAREITAGTRSVRTDQQPLLSAEQHDAKASKWGAYAFYLEGKC